MIDLLYAIGYIALISGAGAAIRQAIFIQTSTVDSIDGANEPLAGWGWAYLLGTAAVGIALYVPLALTGQIMHSAFAAVVACCAILSGWYVTQHCRPSRWWQVFRQSWLFDLPWPLGAAVAVIIIAAAASAMFTPPTTFDARAIYGLTARILFDTGTLHGADFQDVDQIHFNSHYPLLAPLLESGLFWIQGSMGDQHLRVIFFGFATAVVSLLAAELRRYNSRRMAAMAAALFLGAPLVVQMSDGAGLSASVDLPLAGYLTAGTIALMQWLRKPESRHAVLAALMYGAAALTKGEAALWMAAAALAMALLVARRKLRLNFSMLRASCAGLIVLGVILGLSFAVRRQVPCSPYLRSYAAALRWDWLRQLGPRLPDLMAYALGNFVRVTRWNLSWICIAAILLLRRPTRLPKEIWFARVLAGLVGSMYLSVFLVTPYPMHWQMATALPRLFLQLLPLAWLLAFEQLSASGWMEQLSDIYRSVFNQQGRPATLMLNLQGTEDRDVVPAARAADAA